VEERERVVVVVVGLQDSNRWTGQRAEKKSRARDEETGRRTLCLHQQQIAPPAMVLLWVNLHLAARPWSCRRLCAQTALAMGNMYPSHYSHYRKCCIRWMITVGYVQPHSSDGLNTRSNNVFADLPSVLLSAVALLTCSQACARLRKER
jgi:hypothetical protein